jgi:hypothetical protein
MIGVLLCSAALAADAGCAAGWLAHAPNMTAAIAIVRHELLIARPS